MVSEDIAKFLGNMEIHSENFYGRNPDVAKAKLDQMVFEELDIINGNFNFGRLINFSKKNST